MDKQVLEDQARFSSATLKGDWQDGVQRALGYSKPLHIHFSFRLSNSLDCTRRDPRRDIDRALNNQSGTLVEFPAS